MNDRRIKKIKFALSDSQIEEILNLAFERNFKHYCIFLLMLNTGIRVNELINLKISDINFIEGEIQVQSRKNDFFTKTDSSNRLIPVPFDVLREIKRLIGKRKSGYVFISQKTGYKYTKQAIINIINIYSRKCKTIQKSIGSHAFRRTYASRLLQENVDIVNIKKLLGHKKPETTFHYLYDVYNPKSKPKIVRALKSFARPIKKRKAGD